MDQRLAVLALCLPFLTNSVLGEICPGACRCEYTEAGKYRTQCSQPGLREIPVLDPNTQILEIVASSGNPNRFHGLPHKAFLSYRQLEEVHIVYGNLNGIGDHAFIGLDKCRVIDLQHNNIALITQRKLFGIQNSLTSLNLFGNNITELASGTFNQLSRLEYLNIGDNGLHKWSSKLFENLYSLRTLIFDDNPIGEPDGYVDADVFKDTPELREFSAANCSLSVLHAKTFRHMRKLTTLNLARNRLAGRMKENLFSKHLVNLRDLNLDANRMKAIPPRTFNGLDLDSLSLADNRLSEGVERDVFMGLRAQRLSLANNGFRKIDPAITDPIAEGLHHLDISRNPLDAAHLGKFLDSLPDLQELNLTGCGFADVPHGAVPSSARLSALTLAGNRLTDFPPRAVADLAFSGTRLDLRGNEFSSINLELAKELRKLPAVSLHGNPWHCDCGIRPLFEWVQETEPANCTDEPESLSCLVCASPEEYAGGLIRELNASDVVTCPLVIRAKQLNADAKIGLAIAVMVIAILISIIIAIIWKRRQVDYYTNEEKRSAEEKAVPVTWAGEPANDELPLNGSAQTTPTKIAETTDNVVEETEAMNHKDDDRPVSWSTSV
ncbi:PREDICTED: slit homolog 3 protein-like [Priapulus caudatus]|uniref:Slit homolog 3 protein-like n=1 Tax=Priapulus caudatus TaxID=37621 RepID=A0ABM1E053_PRICU|nr:PREDICTED: slit homolog 3 protein-like [Priapulus caudatus]XP_014665573.1 PREDICTED: slit homolog 3 protein-like [Priapulus caudatus]XP_014665574.1 PREDICTED: slit homolog 3 protein-like [Priapulus caudatus]XP_014665575.1 PREDICTED: slit homolog 3 protein-like [Priapulus caudatus]XP_014665576.1 PREDICTED: slit homolog 3 protein-like [Priapulus caudatus]